LITKETGKLRETREKWRSVGEKGQASYERKGGGTEEEKEFVTECDARGGKRSRGNTKLVLLCTFVT